MKVTSLMILTAAVALTSACSSTSSTSGTTAASTAGSSITDASSSNGMTSGTATDAGTAGSAGSSATDASAGAGGSAGSSSAMATASDVNAFMGTFATMDDATFMLTAASSNMLEIQMGQLAGQRANNADVKKFGQMMVQHHGMATQDWKSVATPLGVIMPTTLMPVHQAMLEKVANKSGKEFDEAYMDAMETAHKLDVAMFEVKSKAAQAPAVQTFATKTLPMLRSHSNMASELEKKVD